MLLSRIIIKPRIMRMNPDRRVNILKPLRHGYRSPEIIRTRIAGPDIQHRDNTRVPGTLNNFVAINVKLLAVYVAVGIYEGR
jgi:hypothetical protein